MANLNELLPLDAKKIIQKIKSSDKGGRIKITQRRHPDWEANKERWDFFLDSYIGGQRYIDNNRQEYLYRHPRESRPFFSDRKKRAYYYNYCKPIINVFSNYLFSQAVTRKDFGDTILEWFDDTDGKGTTIDKLSERANILSAIEGHIYAFIDAPPLDSETQQAIENNAATRALDREFKVRTRLILPQDVLDWSEDSQGFRWILFAESSFEDADPRVKRKQKDWFKLWTRQGWTLFNDRGNPEESGANPLGEIPIVKLTHVDLDINKVGESLIEDVAFVNRSIYNWASLLDEILNRQTFSQLVVQGTAEDYDQTILGTSTIFNYPENMNKPEFISPDTSQAGLIQKQIADGIIEMFRMAQLRIAGAQGERYKSILENTYDFNDTNVSLKNKAKIMTRFETDIIELVRKWKNLPKSEIGIIQYPQEFDTVSLTEDIDDAIKLATMRMGQRFDTMLKMRIVSKKFPDISSEDSEEINKQLSEATLDEMIGDGASITDTIGKIPLAIQQLALAKARATEAGDTEQASALGVKINELLKQV